MKRRNFMAASAVAAAVPAATGTAASDGKQYIEWREYQLLPGAKKKLINEFVKNAEIPALHRAGAGKIGVFTPRFGGGNASLYMLIPYPSLEAYAGAEAKLAADKVYQAAGVDVLQCGMNDPAYKRISRTLFAAFDGMPEVAAPTDSKSRVFELRIYHSHNREKARKKIEMFNVAEIEVFHKTGLKPVFFGEALTGDNLPNLTYMLAYDSMDDHAPSWKRFGGSPEWAELRGRKEFADTVSQIDARILRPAAYSEI